MSHVVRGRAGAGPPVLPLGGGGRRGGGYDFLHLYAGDTRLDVFALAPNLHIHPPDDEADADGDDQQNDHHHCSYSKIVCILHCKN